MSGMSEMSRDYLSEVVFCKIKNYLSTPRQSTASSSVQPHDRTQIGKIGKVEVSHGHSPYTPNIISIGPLHYCEDELQPMDMEVFKHKHLNELLNRRGEDLIYKPSGDHKNDELLHKFIKAAIDMENVVRESYEVSHIRTIRSDNFVRMLVIDGCFLLEFLFSWTKNFDYMIKNLDGEGQLKNMLLSNMIHHDILLFENQIPFSVLQKFYEILREYGNYSTDHNMVKLAYDYHYKTAKWEKSIMTFLGPYYDDSICRTDSVSETSNLLHLYHMMLSSENNSWPPFISWSFIDLITRIFRKWIMVIFSWLYAFVSFPLYSIHKIFFANITYPTINLTSATEIEEAGVRLEGSRVDLRFEKGTLLIPVLTLNQQSLCLLKNLLYFEFHNKNCV